MGPYTHPSIPAFSDLLNLTGVWGITIEKVWNCKCHRRVSEAQQGQNFGGANWGQSPNLWREAPENWGQSPNRGWSSSRDRAGEGSGEGARWASPQKISKNWNFYYFFSNFLVFFFDERDCGKAAPRRRCFEGRSDEGLFLGVVFLPSLKIYANFKIKNCKSMEVECVFTCLLSRWRTLCTYFYINDLTGWVWGGSLCKFREFCILQSLHSLAPFCHSMIIQLCVWE